MKTKPFIFVVALCFIAFAGQAQTSKGGFLIGGSLGFSSTKNTTSYTTGQVGETKTINFSISPSVSYFVADNLALGLTLPYSYGRYTYDDGITTKNSQYSIGPMVRYYFPFGKWAFFPHASYTFGRGVATGVYTINSAPSGEFKNKNNFQEFRGGVGLVYFLNSSIGLEGTLFYRKDKHTYDNELFDNTSESKNSGIQFNIGLQIYFSRKS